MINLTWKLACVRPPADKESVIVRYNGQYLPAVFDAQTREFRIPEGRVSCSEKPQLQWRELAPGLS